MEYSKVDNKLQTSEVITRTVLYDYNMLLEQKRFAENEIVRQQSELSKINTLLVEADKLGLKSKQ